MNDISVKKILEQIKYKLDLIQKKYNKYPDVIILGEDIFNNIENYYIKNCIHNSNDLIVYKDKNKINKMRLYGCFVFVDYNDPMRIDFGIFEKAVIYDIDNSKK